MGQINPNGVIEISSSLNKKDKNLAVSHETEHLKQMKEGLLRYDHNNYYYRKDAKSPIQTIPVSEIDTHDRDLPWEKSNKFKKTWVSLKEWVKQDWVRIGTDGKIKGKCGTSKNKKNPDRCLPRAKAERLSKRALSKTARKKKREGALGKQFVKNTSEVSPKLIRRTTKGKGANYRPTSEGAGMTKKGVKEYNKKTGGNL